jgi:hypothetical protein
MWGKKNILEPDRPQMTIWIMCIAYWIPKPKSIYTQNMCYYNNGCRNSPHCYIAHTLPVLFLIDTNKFKISN